LHHVSQDVASSKTTDAPTSAERAIPKLPILNAQWKAIHRKIEEALSGSIEYFLES
jgi:hypothetical protein